MFLLLVQTGTTWYLQHNEMTNFKMKVLMWKKVILLRGLGNCFPWGWEVHHIKSEDNRTGSAFCRNYQLTKETMQKLTRIVEVMGLLTCFFSVFIMLYIISTSIDNMYQLCYLYMQTIQSSVIHLLSEKKERQYACNELCSPYPR